MARRGWNYYSSGADDEITLRENHNAYGRVWFRPRVLRNVAKVDYSTSIFGYKTSMPVYITATALGMDIRLGVLEYSRLTSIRKAGTS
jgi:L-lactate dehydrogenase (cytochrome)